MRFQLATAFLFASALLLACGDDSVTGGGPAGGAPPAGGENPGGEGGGNPIIAGGNGSGGGPTGPSKIGDECVTDADCDDDVGLCITQPTSGFPKGYCTALCDGDVDCGEGVCFEDAQTPFCVFPSSDTSDCRAGYGWQSPSQFGGSISYQISHNLEATYGSISFATAKANKRVRTTFHMTV